MPGPDQGSGDPEPADQAFLLVLELSIADGDPVRGTVRVIGGPQPRPFHGWIDLMSVVSNLLAAAGGTGADGLGGA